MRVNEPTHALGIVLLASIITWSLTLSFGFVWDDFPTIVTNDSLHRWSTLISAFTHDYWSLHQIPEVSGYWRPIPMLTYVFTTQLFGKPPWVFHLVNLLFHLGVVWMVFRLFYRLGLTGLSLVAAVLFFAIHPLHAETVSFVSALPDLQAAFFGLLALDLFSQGGRKRWWALGAFGLALLAKESAVVFFAGFFLLDPLPRSSWKGEGLRSWCGALCVVTAAYIVLHVQVTGGIGARTLWGGALDTHLGTVARLFHHSVLLGFLPFGTTPTRFFPISEGWSDWNAWISLLSLLVFAVLAIGFRRIYPIFARSMLLFFLFWLPVSNLIPAEGLLADRYLYLPALGTALFVGAIWQLGAKRRANRESNWVGLSLVAIVWAGWAVYAALPWKNSETLWRHATKVSPEASVAWNEWGGVLLRQGDSAGARAAFQTALRRQAEHGEARVNLALTFFREGKMKRAEQELLHHLARVPSDAAAWDLMALVLEKRNQFRRSREAIRKAIELAPQNWRYQFDLGRLELAFSNPGRAAEALERARHFAPRQREVLLNLAAAYYHLADWERSAYVYREILVIWPGEEKAKRGLSHVEQLIQIREGKP